MRCPETEAPDSSTRCCLTSVFTSPSLRDAAGYLCLSVQSKLQLALEIPTSSCQRLSGVEALRRLGYSRDLLHVVCYF